MINTKSTARFKGMQFPMTPYSDWDTFGIQYDKEQNLRGLEKAKKTKSYAVPEFDPGVYDSEHPMFGTPDWTEKEKTDAALDLRRFLGRRGLLDKTPEV